LESLAGGLPLAACLTTQTDSMVTGISSNTAAKNNESVPVSRERPRGIPGRLFVFPFVLVTVVLGILMFSVAMRFQTIMARLEEVRSLWPNASQELEPRYKRISDNLMSSNVTPAVKEEWESGLQAFHLSGLFDRQSAASIALERQIEKAQSVSARSPSDFDLPGISKLLQAEQRRRESQDDMIGWLTVQSLRLKLPLIYDPRISNP
jgi:hypothetical protein